MNLIHKALNFAAMCHEGQYRKDKVTPYFAHCSLVAHLVQKYTDATDQMIIAAYLHDVCEDCNVDFAQITKEFGGVVSGYVYGLTNFYTKEKFPDMNRKQRKEKEIARLGDCCVEVQQIKLCDRLANVMEMSNLDKGFQDKYNMETKKLLDKIGHSCPQVAELINTLL